MSDQFSSRPVNANGKAQSYRDLLVWQKSMTLAKAIYELTAEFPSEEKFGLISQMRRAAVSVPSNIAEGQARNTTGEFILFISHAEGSLAELDTQLTLAVELGFLTAAKSKPSSDSIEELRRMLNGLRRAVRGQKKPVAQDNHF
ncbi:MAG TPA: four helix bundle protein [Verrucomicrobiae bacterium]|jgi:four helix bundle protein|nr:four helix bundle protein [Verrucomicrobiae bacterium]